MFFVFGDQIVQKNDPINKIEYDRDIKMNVLMCITWGFCHVHTNGGLPVMKQMAMRVHIKHTCKICYAHLDVCLDLKIIFSFMYGVIFPKYLVSNQKLNFRFQKVFHG